MGRMERRTSSFVERDCGKCSYFDFDLISGGKLFGVHTLSNIEIFLYFMHYYYITMVMDTVQIRLSHGIVERIDQLINTGIYANRSEVIRDAVRRLVVDKLIGIIPHTGDSVREMKELRKKRSKEKFNLGDINKLAT